MLDHLVAYFPSLLRTHWVLILTASLLVYLLRVRQLRWRKYHQIHRIYQQKYDLSGALTPEEAQQVIELCLSYDMPMLMRYSLSLALFKTYGIPSISKILKGTREMGSREGISKRFADTEILISTVLACPITGKTSLTGTATVQGHSHSVPFTEEHTKLQVHADSISDAVPYTKIDDPRAMIAIARVNWLHAKYPIKNEDNLYTLSLAIFEPERWAKKYGWRELSPLECHAFYVFWTEVGRRMGIKDIPETAEDFKEWSLSYQQSAMVPAESNKYVANFTLEEFISVLPNRFGIRNFAKGIAISLLEDIVREAMMYPPQPKYMPTFVDSILKTINLVQLHLCLPRSSPTGPVDSKLPDFASGALKCPYNTGTKAGDCDVSSVHTHDPELMESGGKIHVEVTRNSNESPVHARMYPNTFQRRPWYRPEGQGVFGKLSDKLKVKMGIWEQMPGKELRSGGYRLEEMGPLRYEKDGHEEVIREAERLLGAPISAPWATY